MPHCAQNLQTVAFEITELCNLFCDYCLRNANGLSHEYVTVDKFHGRLRNITRQFPDLNLVALTGGEPFLHPDIVSLAELARGYARSVCITTNATTWDSSNLFNLAQIGNLQLILSLDGHRANIHDRIRGANGAFDRLLQFVSCLQTHDIPFLFNMTVNELNVHCIHNTVSLAADLGARDISIALVKPYGRGQTFVASKDFLITVIRQIKSAKDRYQKSKFKVVFMDPLACVFNPLWTENIGCGAFNRSIHIQCNGKILICTSCDESLGNIDDPCVDLHHLLCFDERLVKLSNRTLQGECGSCELRQQCGGCRCRAKSCGNGFLGADPLCPKTFPDKAYGLDILTKLNNEAGA